MPPQKFKYAELPVFKYQTFNPEAVIFTDLPIFPPEKINSSDRHNADDLFKSDDAVVDPDLPGDSEPEIIEVTPDATGNEDSTLLKPSCS